MYILVTTWDRHWQDGQRTYYKPHQIHVDLRSVADGSEALFIKLTAQNRAESGWRGNIHQVQPSGERVYFVVKLAGRLSAAEISPYENFSSGWFETSDNTQTGARCPRMAELVNGLNRSRKVSLIRRGRYHLFGTDFEARDDMSDDDAVARYDQVWEARIKQKVIDGDVITAQEAMRLIGEKATEYQQRGYFHPEQEHRQFNLENTVFIAQVNQDADPPEHTQLWPGTVKNYDTRTLFVTFETQQERNTWRALAERLRLKDEELGQIVLTSFLGVFSRTKATDG